MTCFAVWKESKFSTKRCPTSCRPCLCRNSEVLAWRPASLQWIHYQLSIRNCCHVAICCHQILSGCINFTARFFLRKSSADTWPLGGVSVYIGAAGRCTEMDPGRAFKRKESSHGWWPWMRATVLISTYSQVHSYFQEFIDMRMTCVSIIYTYTININKPYTPCFAW